MNLGKKLRRMRQARGVTAVELAKRSRVTTGFISQLEHSQTVPSLQTLQRVAAALDVSLTYFLIEESQQPQVVRTRERHIIHLGHDGSRICLLSPLPSQHLELALLELPPTAVSWSTARSHEGQQCHVILQGMVRADYGDHHLSSGRGRQYPVGWHHALPPGEHRHERCAALDRYGSRISLEACWGGGKQWDLNARAG